MRKKIYVECYEDKKGGNRKYVTHSKAAALKNKVVRSLTEKKK